MYITCHLFFSNILFAAVFILSSQRRSFTSKLPNIFVHICSYFYIQNRVEKTLPRGNSKDICLHITHFSQKEMHFFIVEYICHLSVKRKRIKAFFHFHLLKGKCLKIIFLFPIKYLQNERRKITLYLFSFFKKVKGHRLFS